MYIFPMTCKFMRPRLLVLCWGAISFLTLPALAQNANVTQRVIPAAELTDLAFLSAFLEEQFIFPEDTAYTHAMFFDVTQDGFGSNDIMLLYPAEERFLLSTYLPEEMAAVLSTQGLTTDYTFVTSREQLGLEELEQADNPKRALAGLFLEAALDYYPSGNLEGYISLQDDDVRASFWGYREPVWQLAPPVIEQCLQPDAEPLILLAHKQPEIRAFLDVDGCVVVESGTSAEAVITRECRE